MRSVIIAILGVLIMASTSAAAECESPASFKKCLAQTRAEVDICGINMTCKCLRQENVARCYDKCGEDSYYRRLKLGELGKMQIFCSQKTQGESEDLPIIGSEGGSPEPKAPDKNASKSDAPKANSPAPKANAPAPLPSAGDRRRDGVDSAGHMTGANIVNGMDIDRAGSSATVNTYLIAAIVLASLVH